MKAQVRLTVGDHLQNGFLCLAHWSFPTVAAARDFIRRQDKMAPNEACGDPLVDDFTFLLELHVPTRGGGYDYIADSSYLPLQLVVLLAREPVEDWLEERPDPNEVFWERGIGPLLKLDGLAA